MDFRLGLSLLLLLTFFSSTKSKNIRDGPNLQQRHNKRAIPSEFLQPPAPVGRFLRGLPPTDLEPPPPPPPPPSSIRNGRYIADDVPPENRPSRGYFSRLLGWLNPWSESGGLEPPPQSFNPNTGRTSDQALTKNVPFQPERSCNPCNDVPWIPIRGLVDGPFHRQPQNFNFNFRDGYYAPSPSHEIREPDFAYPLLQNPYPEPIMGNHPIPNPHIYPGAMPPLYRAEPFSTPGNGPLSGSQQVPGSDFYRKESSNFDSSLDSRGSSTNIQESVHIQENINQEIQNQGNQGQSIQGQGNQDQEIHGQGNQDQEIQGQGNKDQSYQILHSQEIQGHETQNQDFQHQHSQNQGLQYQEGQNQGIRNPQSQNQEIQIQEGIQLQNNRGQGSQSQLSQGSQAQLSQGQEFQFQGNQNQGIQTQGQGAQFQSQAELIPSIGGQVSSEQIHFENSPVIDLTISSTPLTPTTLKESLSTLSNFGKVPEASSRPSSLIDFLVSSYDDRISPTGASVTTGPTTSQIQGQSGERYEEVGYNEKQPFLEALMDSYYNFKKEMEIKDAQEAVLKDSKTSFNNSGSFRTNGGEDLVPSTPSSRAAKRNKQIQIIIPYTSQYTPRPFQRSFEDDAHGRVMDKNLPRKVPPGLQLDHFDDNVLAQESKNVLFTSLPDISSTPAASAEAKKKKNSIDVQKLQKNIDNWTIQEYSSGMKASTALPNSTRPYLSPSKKIPDEYFTKVESNNTSGDIHNEEAKRSSELDLENVKQMATIEISRVTQESPQKTTPKVELNSPEPKNSSSEVETKDNGIDDLEDKREIHPVYVMTSIPVGKKETKKAGDVESKKKSKKDPETFERAYQILPQAVNNLAIPGSTGPEDVPLWGIMEHEEFASLNSDSDQLPVIHSGHSKVSYARR